MHFDTRRGFLVLVLVNVSGLHDVAVGTVTLLLLDRSTQGSNTLENKKLFLKTGELCLYRTVLVILNDPPFTTIPLEP